MYKDTYNRIKREYEQKRSVAESIFNNFKKQVYAENPKLSEIDAKISKCGIEAAKLSISADAITKEKISKDLKEKMQELKSEKEQLLAKLNIDLKPKYSCEKCEDLGYVYEDNGYCSMCSCFKQELINESYVRSNLYRLKEECFDKVDLTLFSDSSYILNGKAEISPRDNMKKIVEISKKFVEEFDSSTTKNLLFTGTPGVGKTFMSSCIANEIIGKGKTVLYQTSSLLLNSIFDYKFNRQDTSKELYDNLFTVDLLVIDDLGTENLTSAKLEELFTLINSRLITPNTKTIISTNFSLEELAKNYDHRLISRIMGNFNIIRFYGDDIRLK